MKIKVKDAVKVISQPENIYKLLDCYFQTVDKIDQDKEHFFVIHLDTRNKVKVLELISIGTLNASLVHPREVFTRAVVERSAQIIVAHNHPSGVIEPSDEDIEITKRMIQAGEILGIEVLDHIIYTSKSFFSFRQKGVIYG